MTGRCWYRRKRVLLPAALLALAAAALALAWSRSGASCIVVYNETGQDLPGLRLAACAQTKSFRSIPAEGSVRWELAPHGDASEIALELASEPPVKWEGAFVEPRGGYIVTLRLWPDGQVEGHTQVSYWQRVFNGASGPDD